jgi:hypothetical protein
MARRVVADVVTVWSISKPWFGSEQHRNLNASPTGHVDIHQENIPPEQPRHLHRAARIGLEGQSESACLLENHPQQLQEAGIVIDGENSGFVALDLGCTCFVIATMKISGKWSGVPRLGRSANATLQPIPLPTVLP